MAAVEPPPTPSVAPILLPEILGFSPHLLLDDIIDIANDAIRLTVDAMEEFIVRWAEERGKTAPARWDGKMESEMGIISLQTLLESHTDLAFDAFEAWSLRNIFTFAPELPIVVPHQRGLGLHETRQDELALMDEIGELRRELEVQRRLKRLLTRAVRRSAVQRRETERRLTHLSILSALEPLSTTCDSFVRLYDVMSTLPPPDAELSQVLLRETGKRQWEWSRTGYLNWAVAQLLDKTKAARDKTGTTEDPETVKAALEATESAKADALKFFV